MIEITNKELVYVGEFANIVFERMVGEDALDYPDKLRKLGYESNAFELTLLIKHVLYLLDQEVN